MKIKFNILSYLILTVCSLISYQAFAEGLFANNVKEINFNRTKSGKPEIILTLDKLDDVRVIKKEDLEYVILLPETSNTISKQISLEPVSDLIEDVEFKTQPYAGNIKGYTKITIKTLKPVFINAKASLETPEPPKKEYVEKAKQQEKKRVEKEKLKQEQKAKKQEEENLKKQKKEELKKQKKVSQKKTENKDVQKEQTKINSDNQTEISVDEQPETTTEEKVTQEPESEQQAINESSDINNTEQSNNNLRYKSLLTSLGITGILLILLFILKKYNKLRGKIITNKTSQAEEISHDDFSEVEDLQTSADNESEKVLYDDAEMPVHEHYGHQTLSTVTENNAEVTADDILNEKVMPQNHQINDVPEQKPDIENYEDNNVQTGTVEDYHPDLSGTSQNKDVLKEETFVPTPEINPLQNENLQNSKPDNYINEMSQQNIKPKQVIIPVEPIKADELDKIDNNFDDKATPDDVFGDFEDELELLREEKQNSIVEEEQESEEVSEDKPKTIQTDTPTLKTPQTFEFLEELFDEDIPDDIDFEDNSAEKKSTEVNNEVVSEDEENEGEEDDIIKGSYVFTPTKSIYLVDYDGVSVLMASIKDRFVTLKRFDYIVNDPLVVRPTEKTKKKATYIVRIGIYRCVVEVTMKSVELVLEL